MTDEDVRLAFNKFTGAFSSGHIVDPEDFHAAFAKALRAAYEAGRDAGYDLCREERL